MEVPEMVHLTERLWGVGEIYDKPRTKMKGNNLPGTTSDNASQLRKPTNHNKSRHVTRTSASSQAERGVFILGPEAEFPAR